MHVINLFSSWQHNRFVNYTKDIRETLFTHVIFCEILRGGREEGIVVNVIQLATDTACELSWYFIGEIRLIEMHETKLRVPIFFFLFFKCSRSIDWRGDRFFILPDWIYTKAGIARGCYIKNEFSRPMLSTMVRCAWFFFFTISNC